MAYDIVYLIDCSGSMNESKGLRGLVGSKLDLVKKSLVELLRDGNAFNPDDRVALLSFRGVMVNLPEVKNMMALEEFVPSVTGRRIPVEEISALKAGGSTPIGAAIKEALKLLRVEDGRSKRIVLITDGSNTVGENPSLFICDALRQNVRIDVVGLGTSVDEGSLKALADKTSGVFKHVLHAHELSRSLIWQRTPAALPDETAQLTSMKGSLKEELRHLDEMYGRKEITTQKYVELRSGLQTKLLSLEQETREKRTQASKELVGFYLEREKLIHQLTELKARLDKKELDERAYLEAASSIEEKIAWLHREMAARQKALSSLG